jgi:CRP/FNR family transcriptional regulator, cyclic AMP receptor protein
MKTDSVGLHPFFKGLRKEHLQLLSGSSMFAQFGPGEVIFQEGAPARHFYLIEHGKVAIEAEINDEGLVQIQTLSDGEPLGWSWLFPPYIWHFHARALQRTTAVYYDAVALRNLCEEEHDFGYELMKRFSAVMLDRLQATRKQMAKMYADRAI